MRHLSFLILLLININAGSSLFAAEKSKLAPPAAPHKSDKDPPEKKPESRSDSCYLDFATPLYRNYTFVSPDEFFITAQASKSNTKSRARFRINQISLKDLTIKALLAVELDGEHAVMALGRSPESLGILSFVPYARTCGEGPAKFLGVPLDPKRYKESGLYQGRGFYSLVYGPFKTFLYSLKKRYVLEIDALSFQSRPILAQIGKDERPIYAQGQPDQIVTYKEESPKGARVLRLLKGEDKPMTWTVPENSRIVQNGDNIAIAHFHYQNNSIEVILKGGWSKAEAGTFKVELPATHKVSEAFLDMAFTERALLIQGATTALKHKWQRIFLINLRTGKPYAKIPIKSGSYIRSAFFDPRGEVLIIEDASRIDDISQGFRALKYQEARWLKFTKS